MLSNYSCNYSYEVLSLLSQMKNKCDSQAGLCLTSQGWHWTGPPVTDPTDWLLAACCAPTLYRFVEHAGAVSILGHTMAKVCTRETIAAWL